MLGSPLEEDLKLCKLFRSLLLYGLSRSLSMRTGIMCHNYLPGSSVETIFMENLVPIVSRADVF